MQLILQSIDDKIVAKNAQISETETELAQMEELRQQRYDAMKIRIRFMYENSDRSLLDTLFGAYSMSDFLNRVEYFSQVMDYDRAQLTEYQSLLDGLAEKQDTYQLQKEELVALQEEQQKEVDKLSEIVAQTRTQLDLAKEETAGAKQEVSELDSQLEAQLAYEAVLEAQKAAEDKARMEEIKRQEEELRRQREEEERRRREEEERRRQEAEENGTEPEDIEDSQPASAEDLELLACIIQCEAEGEPYAGKLAVGSVVMNRVASSSFPNTVMGVIYQPGQFSPVASGRMAARLAAGANSECRQAAQEVLNGNITVPYLYFRVDNGTIDGYVLGNHVFY
ncbi:MAG: cell wall hydrolase [Eubacterium sp.]|nr:cell wall hydrolase [Eubacterium sp.]